MEHFYRLTLHADLTSHALKVVQYLFKALDGQKVGRVAIEKLINSCASIRRFLRLLSTLVLLFKLKGAKSLGYEHLSDFSQLFFNILDHLLIHYNNSPDPIGGLISILRNWLWVVNSLAQIASCCYKTAQTREKLQNLHDANAHNKFSDRRKEYQKTLRKDKIIEMSTISSTFDLPLCIFCCDRKSLNPLFAYVMGIISASAKVSASLERLR